MPHCLDYFGQLTKYRSMLHPAPSTDDLRTYFTSLGGEPRTRLEQPVDARVPEQLRGGGLLGAGVVAVLIVRGHT